MAEIIHPTLLEIVNSILDENEAESDDWAETLQMAVHIRNLAPTSAHSSGKTPSELWNRRHPYIGPVRAFGSVSYVHISKVLQNKLESYSHTGLLIGYRSTNIYRIHLPDTHCIICARDVQFDETSARLLEDIVDINAPPLLVAVLEASAPKQ